jgi:hypothetical protein
MRLFIIIPMFTSSQEEVEERLKAWTEWYREEEENGGGWDRLQRRYALVSIDAIPLYPGSDIAVRPEEPDPVTIRMPSSSSTRVEKGLAVRLALVTAVHQTDRGGVAARHDAKCVLIDGSGAFDFENIFMVADLLFGRGGHSDAPAVVVLGTRPEGSYGMSEGRKAIEDFEHFVLLRALDQHHECPWGDRGLPPDGQAGCWGLSVQSLSTVALSAPGYEIEIDLFSSALLNGILPEFTSPLVMRPRGSSSAEGNAVAMSTAKMDFLEQKLRSNPRKTHEAWQEFLRAHSEIAAKVPLDYAKRIESRATRVVRHSSM